VRLHDPAHVPENLTDYLICPLGLLQFHDNVTAVRVHTKQIQPARRCAQLPLYKNQPGFYRLKLLTASQVLEVGFGGEPERPLWGWKGGAMVGAVHPPVTAASAFRGGQLQPRAAPFHPLGTIVLRVVARQGYYA